MHYLAKDPTPSISQAAATLPISYAGTRQAHAGARSRSRRDSAHAVSTVPTNMELPLHFEPTTVSIRAYCTLGNKSATAMAVAGAQSTDSTVTILEDAKDTQTLQ